jgi:hypothetical protein
MKTKIILLSTILAVFTITVANTKGGKAEKLTTKKNSVDETRVAKGLAMEDKNQFN